MDAFFLVLARNGRYIPDKIEELKGLGVPYVIVCGERLDRTNVVYREPEGKWDAVNFGSRFVPEGTDVVVLNDVDTTIHNLKHALSHLEKEAGLVYCRVKVPRGPQVKFYKILDPIRKRLHVAASGELMLIKKEVFDRVLPVPACLAEDSYILFKALEMGYRAHFCTKAYVTTERTADAKQEEEYKARTTLGIYQALEYSRPPVLIRLFYKALPFMAPLLSLAGEDGRAWARGIRRAVKAPHAERTTYKF